jgi:hypothetical protein
MSTRVTNWSLYVVLFALTATGVALFTTSRAGSAWVYDTHRLLGAALCVLFIPKAAIILRALHRRIRRGAWDAQTYLSLLLLLLAVSSIGMALAWTLNALPFWVNFGLIVTPLALHWYAAIAVIPLFLWHAWARWSPPPRVLAWPSQVVRSPVSRRRAVALAGIGIGSLLTWRAIDGLSALAPWTRRFTGSRLVSSFSGNDFPVTHSDAPPSIDVTAWQLTVEGEVSRPLDFRYPDFLSLAVDTSTATLDCTLGWASTQSWRGVGLTRLLAAAGRSELRPVTVFSVTGVAVLLAPHETAEALLATHVGDEPLNDAHGFPVRLVVSPRRGYQWLKWINRIVVA